MPPVALSITARLAAAVPSIPHRQSRARRHSASPSCRPRRSTSSAESMRAALPSSAASASWISTRPGAEIRRSEDTCDQRFQAWRSTISSVSLAGEKAMWPPSEASVAQRSPLGIRADTPRPVLAPMRPITPSARASPPPIRRFSSGASLGSAIAIATKSFTASRVCMPSAPRTASIENCQSRLVMRTMSPSIGFDKAMAACSGRGPSMPSR